MDTSSTPHTVYPHLEYVNKRSIWYFLKKHYREKQLFLTYGGVADKTLTVATVQYNCTLPDKKNTEIGLRYVREAKVLGADIVLFPEYWIIAYAFPDIVEKKLPQTEIENHPDFKAWYDAGFR